jgi:hypothetical protein
MYHGRIIPVPVIDALFFPGQSYRLKRMAKLRRQGLIATETYAIKKRGNNPARVVGKLYRLTELGIQIAEQSLGKEPRSRIRLNHPTKEQIEQCWHLGELRIIAHVKNSEWLYGKQVRERDYIQHNIQLSALAGGICINQIPPKPSKQELSYLKTSIDSLCTKGITDHMLPCMTDSDRRIAIEHIIGTTDELPDTLNILTYEQGKNYLSRRLSGEQPYTWLTAALKETFSDIEIAEADHSNPLTPLIARAGTKTYYLADYSDGNIAELLRIYRYDSALGERYGKPGETLMQVRDKAQLDEIAGQLDSQLRHKSKITYILMEPYEDCNVFVIEDGRAVPR